MTDEDRPIDDAHLRAALAHAPDRDTGPPAHLSARIRAEALRATTSPPRPGWRQRLLSSLDLLQRPAIGAAFASLVLGTAIVLIWRDADVPQVMQPNALKEPPAAAMRDHAPPAPATPGRAETSPAADQAEAPAAPPAPKTAEAPPARQREPRRTAPAAEDSRAARQPAPSSTAPPRIVAAAPAAVAPPSPGPTAPAAQAPAPPPAAPAAEAGPPAQAAPAPAESPEPSAAAPAPPPAAPAALAGGEAERRLDKASVAPAAATAALARKLAAASTPLDPLAPLQSTLAAIEPAGAWLREVEGLTRGRWQLLRAPAAAAPPLYGPGGALLGHLAVDDAGVLWQPSSLTAQAWRAPLPATETERLRRALADWRDLPGTGAPAPR